MLTRFPWSKILCLSTAAVLCACSLLTPIWGPRIELERLTLNVVEQANDDAPIAVDFVAAKEADLFRQISGLSARQWFSEREQYRRDFRQQLSVWSLELVPGQFMEVRDFPFAGKRAAGMVVFADYGVPGAHRLRLGEEHSVRIRFDLKEMRLLDAGGDNR